MGALLERDDYKLKSHVIALIIRHAEGMVEEDIVGDMSHVDMEDDMTARQEEEVIVQEDEMIAEAR